MSYVCVFLFFLILNIWSVLGLFSESLAQLLSLESTDGYFQMLTLAYGVPLCFRYSFVSVYSIEFNGGVGI